MSETRASDSALEPTRTLHEAGRQFFEASVASRYSYQFSWLGRPIIQYPQDLLALQEIVWLTRPDLIIETGIAHGGSLVFYASMLEMLGGDGHVLGVDVEIRTPNRDAIQRHPLQHRISMLEGSSVDPRILEQVAQHARAAGRVMVALDSNHEHDHVLQELRAYSRWVTPGCYLVVFDTAIERLPPDTYPDRKWGHGNNPHTAVRAFLLENDQFEVDRAIEEKIVITVAPGGYLLRGDG